MRKLFVLFMIFAAGLLLVACETDKKSELAQGVTETEILVGNTAVQSGGYAIIGVPFNAGMEAVFKEVNDNGGIGGRKIKFVSYDDEFNASKGYTFTEKLVEEDKVFALVGHFGTPTVGATVDYIQEMGIPMVYAATGINSLYFQKTEGNPVMAVQPIYRTEGRILAARILNEKLFGANADQAIGETDKIGVIYTNDDVGNSIKTGIDQETRFVNKYSNFAFEAIDSLGSNAATAITKLKDANVKAVILAMNQFPFAATYAAMANASFNVPVFTSYVNADVTYVDHNVFNVARPIYTNAWVDVFSDKGKADVENYVKTIDNANLSAELKTAYKGNSFAIAGYVAATVFVEGLKRVAEQGKDLTWENYIAAMESAQINIPMGGQLDYTGGKRWGIDSLSLLKYSFVLGDNPATPAVETDFAIETFSKIREIENVDQIRAK